MSTSKISIPSIEELLSNRLLKPIEEISMQDITTLAITENNSGIKSNLLNEIILTLLNLCKKTDSQTQIEIIELTECFNFQRQKESLEIYENVILFKSSEKELLSFSKRRNIATHQRAINSISWALFSMARYVVEPRLQELVFQLFVKLIGLEKPDNDVYFDESKSAPVLLKRVFFEQNWSGLYENILDTHLSIMCENIRTGGDLPQNNISAFKIMYSGILDCEIRTTEWKNDHELQITQYKISPQSSYWTKIQKYLDFGKQYIVSNNPNINILNIVIESYTNLIASLNRTILPEKECENADSNVAYKFISIEFKWIKNILEQNSLKDIQQKLLRNAWLWHKEYSSVSELKQLANECESLFFKSQDLQFYENLFEYSEVDAKKKAENYFFDKLKTLGTIKDIWSFIDNAEKYSTYSNSFYVYSSIIWRLGNEFLQLSDIISLIIDGANRPQQLPVSLTCLNGLLKKARDKYDEPEIKRIIISTESLFGDKTQFLLGLYQSIHKEYIGKLTSADLEYFLSVRNVIPPETLPLLYSSFCLPFWSSINSVINQEWDNLNSELKAITIGNIVDKISVFSESYSFDIDKSKYDWIIDKTFSLPDMDLLRNFDYAYIKISQLYPHKHTLDWLYDVISNRFKHAQQTDIYHVYPKNFKVSLFVDTDSNSKNNDIAINNFIERYVKDWYTIYRFGEFLVLLDNKSNLLSTTIANKIEQTNDFERILRLSTIAGFYDNYSIGWDIISLAACKKVNTCNIEDRKRIYSELIWKGIQSYTSAYNEIAKKYYEDLRLAEDMFNKADQYRKEFWQFRVQFAQMDLDREKKELSFRLDRGQK
jgi:hypothetical protein